MLEICVSSFAAAKCSASLEDWHSVVGFVVNVLQGAWPFLSSAAFLGEAG